MKRTIIIYSIFCTLIVLVYMGLKAAGIETMPEMAPYLMPISVLLLVFSLIFDYKGFFYIILALLPFYRGFLNYEIGLVTFNPYTTGIIFLSLISLGSILFRGRKISVTLDDVVIILLSLCYLISTLLSEDLIGSGYLAFHAIFIPVLSYFVIKTNLQTQEQLQNAIFFLCFGIFIFGIFSILDFAISPTREKILGLPPIGVATLSIFPLISCLYNPKWRRLKLIPVTLVYLLTCIFTFSRVYLLMLILSPLIYRLCFRGKAFKMFMTMLIATFLLSTTLPFIVAPPDDNMATKIEMKEQEKSYSRLISLQFWKYTFWGRVYSYKDGLLNFAKHPFGGTGLQQGFVFKDGRKVGTITRHNFHVEWLEYGGIIGYALYALVFILFFKRLNRFASENRLAAILLTSIFIMICNSFTNGIMHGIMPVVIFVLMGLSYSIKDIELQQL